MSSALAYSLPAPSIENGGADFSPSRVRIVTTRAQRKARPRIFYALVTTAGLFTIFIAQLLLSISLSGGAYQINSLLGARVTADRVQSALNEKLQVIASTQNLAANARKIGMVGSSDPGFLNLRTGTVSGSKLPAAVIGGSGASAASVTADVPNKLLTPADSIDESFVGDASTVAPAGVTAAPAVKSGTASSTTGAAAATAPTAKVTSGTTNPDALPSPVTH
ncbi:hypothetical protein [Galbitalea soli]|uniref:Cell division protein FtsL n=1 Tax=Galbitalea soli TaxID=1268042 RepID=A0A7C9PL74_9MICO|nr:hypothetical protein [Galbitalea soli]NEM90005.1 hypothetical protein [Galbitalea soli]NYJ30712.1 hypothetical protein [Galbitalea soli]